MKNENKIITKHFQLSQYKNISIDKLRILQDNQKKSGIYMFTNLINGNRYIGSSNNLSNRLINYYNINYLKRNICMRISLALLKYAKENFSLEIIEYCEPEQCIEREKYFIKLLSPEYNIVQDPTKNPMFGHTHSNETLIKMSDAKTGKNNYMFDRTGENHPMF
jgi:group I intron endonuclease